ncbi:MAG: hypothetical protein ACT4P7_04280 [Gemmatimonadaceae bacterium]
MSAISIVRVSRHLMTTALLAVSGCGLPTKQDVDLAQTVMDLGTALQDVQQNQLDLQDRIDSLTVLVNRQDSTIRTLANLIGSPLPPR